MKRASDGGRYGSFAKGREDRFVAREALGRLIGVLSIQSSGGRKFRGLVRCCRRLVTILSMSMAIPEATGRGRHCGTEQEVAIGINLKKNRKYVSITGSKDGEWIPSEWSDI